MNNAAPGTPTRPQPEAAHIPHTIWDRLLDDLHKRPRRYINGVIIISIPVMLLTLGIKFLRDRQEDQLGEVATRWSAAWAPEATPQTRVAALQEVLPLLKSPEQQAACLYDITTTYKDLAEAAATQEEKLGHYQKLLDHCRDLKSKGASTLWAKMVTKPPAAGTTALAYVSQLEEIAQHEIAWLKEHPFVGTAEGDPNLKATIELDDGRKIVIGKFYSSIAPLHVQNFVELARRGYFDGTAFSRTWQGYKKGSSPKQGEKAPNLAVEGGHPMTKVTPDDREDDESPVDIGYSVPEEPNMLVPARGRVASILDTQTGGDSPSRFKIFADEPTQSYLQDTMFAEVTEGLDVVDSIVNAPSPETRPTWAKELVRIKKVTVEGSVHSPPSRPFPPDLRMPDAPKPASSPAASRPESGPEGPSDTRPLPPK